MKRPWKPAISSRLVQDEVARQLDLAEEAAGNTDCRWSSFEIRGFVQRLRTRLRLSKRYELRGITGRNDIRELVPITRRRRRSR